MKNPTTPDPRCGTYRGYAAHRLRNEKPCQPCSDANVSRTIERRVLV